MNVLPMNVLLTPERDIAARPDLAGKAIETTQKTTHTCQISGGEIFDPPAGEAARVLTGAKTRTRLDPFPHRSFRSRK